jgi:hypothetical protein
MCDWMGTDTSQWNVEGQGKYSYIVQIEVLASKSQSMAVTRVAWN